MISLFENLNKIDAFLWKYLTKIRLERDRKPKEASEIEEIKKIILKSPGPRSFHVNLSNTEQTDISDAV